MAVEILDSRVYRGPNIWARVPVIVLKVNIGELEDRPSNVIDGFTDDLIGLIPTLYEHYCSLGRPGGFIERLREGTWMGHVVEHVALELQSLAGSEGTRGLTRSTDERGIYNVVYQYQQPDLGKAAGALAVRLVNALIYRNDEEFNYQTELETLIRLAERIAYGPSTKALVDEADRRGIPVIRLDPRRSLVQLGHGVHQKRIWATVTSSTSDIAVDIAGNKRLTNQLLRGVGIPVPRSITVGDADEAVAAARSVRHPVVLKPLDGNHGRGVQINLRSDEEVREAFAAAYAESRNGTIVVESFIVGRDYRILIVGGKMIACAERVPAHVVGDGQHTVRELVDIANSDPRRGIGHEKVLTRITVDDSVVALLEANGFSLDAVPDAGTFVQLRLTGNMSTGGISIDRTDEIHPDNVEIAEQAAQVIGLDVAGIDMITPDISNPVKDTGGAICEVNAGPGFRMHTHPTEGIPRDVARPVLDLLFPRGEASRVPIIAVTGTNGKTTTSRMIAHILQMAGRRVGMTTTDGIYIDGTQIMRGDMSGPQSAQMVLQNPTIDHAVLETARGGILRSGLGFDRCDVAVVTNVAGDHLGLNGINTLRDLARVKAVVPAATFRDGHVVLNGDDKMCIEMESRSRGDVIYFTMDENNEKVREHLRARGKAVILRQTAGGEVIFLAEGKRETAVLDVRHIPATFEGRARANVKNALAATGAAFGSNLPLEAIRTGLRSFSTSFYQAPGRLNLLEVGGFRVIVDYCHNPHGMEELAEFIRRMMPSRTIGMIAVPGDRRDEDVKRFTEVAAPVFDEFVIREDTNPRGRERGEVADLITQTLYDNGVSEDRVSVVLNELEAAEAAMDHAKPDDLVVLLADKPAEVWELVVARTSRAAVEPAS
ncbi:MAG: cyanophycin synthetase [Thermomicrobiales bacterium]|nr:cyanophycin synthetase [Thermomicrobiales bacterium]